MSPLAALLFLSGATAAHISRGSLSQRSLRPADEKASSAADSVPAAASGAAGQGPEAVGAEDGMVKPFSFDQKMLICNAYPSAIGLACSRNDKNMMGEAESIGFRQCRYVQENVQAKDRLDLSLHAENNDLKSTFEVGALPATDAILLLVPYRKPGSPLIRFQSFAFPQGGERKDAQLAVIDAFAGNTSAARLIVQDHIDDTPVAQKADGAKAAAVSFKAKRQEQLSFDRVYQVEAGLYDASVEDTKQEVEEGKKAPKVVNLAQDQSYVVIRTGDDRVGESLVVFPETPLPQKKKVPSSGTRSLPLGLGWLALVAAAALRA